MMEQTKKDEKKIKGNPDLMSIEKKKKRKDKERSHHDPPFSTFFVSCIRERMRRSVEYWLVG